MVASSPSPVSILLAIAIVGAVCHLLLLLIEGWHRWHIGAAAHHLVALILEVLHQLRR
jgi:hypothetical protein